MHMQLRYQQANTIFAEHPVGDPFAGPAYGQYQKSKGLGKVFGVIAGVAAAMTGFGMVAAGGLKSLATVQGLAGGAMAAGGVAQAVGTVTGNKKLARIGSTLSLVGGGVSMAGDMLGGAASLSGGSGLSNAGASMKAGMGNTMDKFSSAFQKVTGGQSAASTNMSVTDGLASAERGLGSGLQGGGGTGLKAEGFGTSIAQQPSSSLAVGNTGGLAGGGGAQTITLDAGGSLGGGLQYGNTSMTGGVGPSSAGGGAANAGQVATAPSKGILGKAMDFVQTPGGMNLAGNALMGMGAGEEYEVAQKQLDFVKEKYADDKDNLNRELANMNFQYEVIDPSDPEAEAKKAAARLKGIPTITLGVNANAAPVQPTGVTMQPNQIQTAGAY